MSDLVPVYSIAKLFTAVAVLADPVIDLDDAIGTHARVPDALGHLRVGDLLRHRSGLGDYFGWNDYREAVAGREPAWPDDLVLERAAAQGVAEPGGFQYSNIGYLMLRHALEQRHGVRLTELLVDRVLGPLGVTSVHPLDRTDDWAGVRGSAVPDVAAYDPRWVYPGTFAADPDEIAAAVAALLGGALGAAIPDVLRRSSLRLEAPGHPFAEPGYGFGVMTDGVPPTVLGHGGGGPGFTLFVLARADGSSAHLEVVADEVDDRPLVAACLQSLGG
ncbi:serine hydrolase domain-containing protein [Cellulomonas rhizosphaerae]|uniref:Class A beta-lactamase-related serine hydrolase n=1 Tax=Cellulomonas rhizosphaerae TaxID=2293719 RepID=A0A413RKX6_9CELL|nr:serine hydrolase domain-containing protein [Cellulomonas rhizosphaerae]RHA40262.1 class A beta-lactamase-related serine hydrolase [Cellulomonas rhizosphaerae]